MLDILIDAAISALTGVTVGYCVAKMIDALSESFAELWRRLVAVTREMWGYVTEATERFLASVSEFLDENWSEIESSLRNEELREMKARWRNEKEMIQAIKAEVRHPLLPPDCQIRRQPERMKVCGRNLMAAPLEQGGRVCLAYHQTVRLGSHFSQFPAFGI